MKAECFSEKNGTSLIFLTQNLTAQEHFLPNFNFFSKFINFLEGDMGATGGVIGSSLSFLHFFHIFQGIISIFKQKMILDISGDTASLSKKSSTTKLLEIWSPEK